MRPAIDLISEAFKLFWHHGSLYLGYAAWTALPLSVVLVLDLLPKDPVLGLLSSFLAVFDVLLLVYIGIILAQITTVLLQKKKTPLASVLARTRVLFFPVLLILLLHIVAVLGGSILFVLPGILFAIWFIFAIPCAIFEHKRGMDALTSSRMLFQGQFWALTWRLAAGPTVVLFGLAVLLSPFAGSLGSSVSDITAALATPSGVWFGLADTLAVRLIFFPFLVIYGVSLYNEAVSAKAAAALASGR